MPRNTVNSQQHSSILLGYEGSNQYRLWDKRKSRLIRRRDVSWGPLQTSTPPSSDTEDKPSEVSEDEDVMNTVTVAGRILQSPENEASPSLATNSEITANAPREDSFATAEAGYISDSSEPSDQESVISNTPNPPVPDPPRRSQRIKNAPKDYSTIRDNKQTNFGVPKKGFARLARATPLTAGAKPRTYKEAVNGPEAAQWITAMQKQWNSLQKMKT